MQFIFALCQYIIFYEMNAAFNIRNVCYNDFFFIKDIQYFENKLRNQKRIILNVKM